MQVPGVEAPVWVLLWRVDGRGVVNKKQVSGPPEAGSMIRQKQKRNSFLIPIPPCRCSGVSLVYFSRGRPTVMSVSAAALGGP